MCQIEGPTLTDKRINATPYSGAASLCEAHGGELAEPSDVQTAFDTGMHRVRWGWVNNGSKR